MDGETTSYRLALVDDHQMMIDGLKALMRKEKDLIFEYEDNNPVSFLNWISEHHQSIDLVLTDISMPQMSGLTLTTEIKKKFPQLKVLVLSMHGNPEIVGEVLATDAEGYILKNTGREELIVAVRKILDGGTYYSQDVITALRKKAQTEIEKVIKLQDLLTTRELEIVGLICEELTTVEIAERLFISPRTVDTHRKHILEKTEARSVVGLIKMAFASGLMK